MSGGVPPTPAVVYREIASGLLASLEDAVELGDKQAITKAIYNLGALAHVKVTNTASIPGFDAWHKKFVQRFRTSSQTQTVTLLDVRSLVRELQQLY